MRVLSQSISPTRAVILVTALLAGYQSRSCRTVTWVAAASLEFAGAGFDSM